MNDRACGGCGYLRCSCAPALPTPEQAVEGAAASIVAEALRELGYVVERVGSWYVVDGARVEEGEMWERYIGPIVGSKV